MKHEEGERRASTNWPIQKYQWTDYMANPGDTLHYGSSDGGPDKDNLRADTGQASDWTEEITLSHEVTPKIEAHFNGASSQPSGCRAGSASPTTTYRRRNCEKIIATPGDPFRNYLAGPLGARLFDLLATAAKEKRDIYAALYELDDEQLETALAKIGQARPCRPRPTAA